MEPGDHAVASLRGERAHVKPGDIHSYGLKLLKKHGFQTGQSVDITFLKGQRMFFALDAFKQTFYFDPAPASIPLARLIFRVYAVDKITGAGIYEREKEAEEQTTNGLKLRRLRTLGVQVQMDDPVMPVLHIQCLPYASVGNIEYLSRLALAQRILMLLGDAIYELKNQ